MKKLKKILLILTITLTIIIGVLVASISQIAEYLVEKYDTKYSGREITMDWAYVNPFTGYIHLRNLYIYEYKNDTVFFYSKEISANVSILKLFSKTYEITELTLSEPRGIIIQNKKEFNFNDLIAKFAPKKNQNKTKTQFSILNIKIKDGTFYYREKQIPIHYSIKKVNFESNGIQWDEDTVNTKFSFISGIGKGDIKGDFTINLKNNDYRFATLINKFDLNIIEQYLKDLTNYGSFSASLDADMKGSGNLNNKENITTSGQLSVNNFHFGKNDKEDYASFDKLSVSIRELSPNNHKYFFDSIGLSHPYFKYERYDSLDNVQAIFGKKGSKIKSSKADEFNLIIEIANYVKILSKNFFKSNYKINRVAIYEGEFQYNDYSLSEKFAAKLTQIQFIADSIDKNQNRVNANLTSNIQPYGNLSVKLSINPNDSGDFDIHYHIQKLSAPMFNPYIINYTSFPLDRGTIEFKGVWNVRNSAIQSKNHITIIDPRIASRQKNEDTKSIPVPLIMYFIRERGNVIDYEIPITGNLKNPKFHLKDVLIDALENFIVKPPTTPYRTQVKNTEREIEKSLTLKWEMSNSDLTRKQEKFIRKIANFLADNPAATITIAPKIYDIKEKEYILLFEAKKKYFLSVNNRNANSFSENDSVLVNKMSVKDPQFVKYLNNKTQNFMLFSIQEKCSKLIDLSIVNKKLNELNKERKKSFMFYFIEEGLQKQIKMLSEENTIPYNGFSFYKIDYKGKYPDALLKAHEKMNEYNNEVPRKRFKIERNKNKRSL